MKLVAFLGKDKENWGQISALINRGEWENIVIVKCRESEGFPPGKYETIVVDSGKPLIELKDDLLKKLKEKVHDFEVALSIASGSGKEHMALISALLSLPAGIRLVVYTKEGVKYIN